MTTNIITGVLYLLLGYLLLKYVLRYSYWRKRVPVRVGPYTFVMARPWIADLLANKEVSQEELRESGLTVIDTTKCDTETKAELIGALYRRNIPFVLEIRRCMGRIRVEFTGERLYIYEEIHNFYMDPTVRLTAADIQHALDYFTRHYSSVRVELLTSTTSKP